MWCQKKIVYMVGVWVVIGVRKDWEVNYQEMQKGLFKSMVAQSEKTFFPLRFQFWFCFRSVWYSPGVVRFGKNLDVVLYGLE